LTSLPTIAVEVIYAIAGKTGMPRPIDERASGEEAKENTPHPLLGSSGTHPVQQSEAALLIASLKTVDLPYVGTAAALSGNNAEDANTTGQDPGVPPAP
jgi:hypothetical protein